MNKIKIMIAFLLSISFASPAQFVQAEIGVDGLTCSACMRAVELSIRKLDFIDSVAMNLENTEGKLFFKPNRKADISKVAHAVTDAGFSVRYLKGLYRFENLNIKQDDCVKLPDITLQFIKAGPQEIRGEKWLNFLGKKYQSKSDFKSWKNDLKSKCENSGKEIYFVTF